MAGWEQKTKARVEVKYQPGTENEAADQLSCWRKKGLVGYCAANECSITVGEMLEGRVLETYSAKEREG